MHERQHHPPREEVTQVAETNQEADTPADNITDVSVPAKVAVKNHTEIPDARALPNGPATDPYADRGETTGVLPSAEEKDFRF